MAQTPQASITLPQQVFGMAVLNDWIASSIQVAAYYGIADLLQDGPRSIAELAAATQTHPDSLYRLLRALTSVGFFEEMDTDIPFAERRFAQTPFSQCLCQDVPGSMYAMARLFGSEWEHRSWGELGCVCKSPIERSMRRGELTDEQWEKLAPLLPPQKPKVGRPARDHRLIVNGILWILRTGAPWRDLPERYGSWRTVASRFYRWVNAGVWQRVLQALQQQAEAQGQIDWEKHSVDSTIIRAHQHAAGAKGGSKSRSVRQESRRF